MRVLAHRAALGHRGDDGRAKVLRMRAREANPLDSVNGVAGAQKLAKLDARLERQVAAVRVHVLAEQGDLANPLARQALDLRDNLARPAALLSPSDGRDDAVRALRVAAHRDLHPCLEAALAVHRQRAGEAPLVAGPEAAALDAESSGTEPLAEVRDRPRSEGDVDVRIELEEAFALRLGVAAADGDHLLRIAVLQRRRLREVRREALVGLLADRARVEHDHVRLGLLVRLPQPERLEESLDPLRVMGVHLAPEGGDVVALHARHRSRARAVRLVRDYHLPSRQCYGRQQPSSGEEVTCRRSVRVRSVLPP